MPKKSKTQPTAAEIKADPEIIQVQTRPTGKVKTIEVDAAHDIPAIVLEKAHSVDGEPWIWTIYPTQVVIVMKTGKKYRFPLP
jgi:hypothetical protein